MDFCPPPQAEAEGEQEPEALHTDHRRLQELLAGRPGTPDLPAEPGRPAHVRVDRQPLVGHQLHPQRRNRVALPCAARDKGVVGARARRDQGAAVLPDPRVPLLLCGHEVRQQVPQIHVRAAAEGRQLPQDAHLVPDADRRREQRSSRAAHLCAERVTELCERLHRFPQGEEQRRPDGLRGHQQDHPAQEVAGGRGAQERRCCTERRPEHQRGEEEGQPDAEVHHREHLLPDQGALPQVL